MGSSNVPISILASYTSQFEESKPTLAGSIKRPHVEHVNAPHLSEQFQTLKTSSLLEIAGDLTSLTTGGKEVIFGLHLCIVSKVLG
jgi:hypothetical protein